MIARLVEDWLTRVNERQLETPFTFLLLSQGHRVLHLTRHGEMEQGKDVISLAPDETPCAFQLKTTNSGRIRQGDWDEFLPQIGRLIELPIKHPSVSEDTSHRAFLVTNGDLDEPVRLEIIDRNKHWEAKYGRRLETIVKGQLLHEFQALQTDFWPTKPSDIKTLLEHFLAAGNAPIKKDSFYELLQNEIAQSTGKPPVVIGRAVASAAILGSFAIAPYAASGNHVAQAEAWVLFLGAVLSVAEKETLDSAVWLTAVRLAESEAFRALGNLWEEVKNRRNLFEGNLLADAIEEAFPRARTTLVLGFISAWALMKLASDDSLDIDVISILERFEGGLWLWGESAVPHFLAWFWLKSRRRGGLAVEGILLRLLRSILAENGPGSELGLPDPYHPAEEVISKKIVSKRSFDEFFRLRSYTLESLVHLAAIRLWRQHLAALWPKITHITFDGFYPSNHEGFYQWRSQHGIHRTRVPRQPESWARLQAESSAFEESKIPVYLRQRPWLLLLFMLVYPHRLQADVVKFLDRWVRSLNA